MINANKPLILPDSASSKEQDAIIIYFELGPQRTYKDVAAQLGVSGTTIGNYARKYNFEARIKQQQENIQDNLIKMREEVIMSAGEKILNSMDMLVQKAIDGALNGGLESSQQTMLKELLNIGGLQAVEKLYVKHDGVSQEEVLALLGITEAQTDAIDAEFTEVEVPQLSSEQEDIFGLDDE